jgi:hypothetical protein
MFDISVCGRDLNRNHRVDLGPVSPLVCEIKKKKQKHRSSILATFDWN